MVDILKNVSRRPIEPTLESDLIADLGFDSLQVLEVIAELEDRFAITIPADPGSPVGNVPRARTVGDVAADVARRIKA